MANLGTDEIADRFVCRVSVTGIADITDKNSGAYGIISELRVRMTTCRSHNKGPSFEARKEVGEWLARVSPPLRPECERLYALATKLNGENLNCQ